jgi:predicted nucleic acid-binding protein
VRVFFDTNVLVSAFLARGLCADLLRLVLNDHTLVCSEVVLAELRAVLSRKARLPLQQIEAIEAFLRDQPVASRPATILQRLSTTWRSCCRTPTGWRRRSR